MTKDLMACPRVYARMPLYKIGAFAEYVAINKDAIAKIPDYLKFDEAACVPLTALTAIQAFELMNPSKGEKIFISGGTGSLGAMAIPIAKDMGLHIITNGSEKNRHSTKPITINLPLNDGLNCGVLPNAETAFAKKPFPSFAV